MNLHPLAVFAPLREGIGRFHAPQLQGNARWALHGKGPNLPRWARWVGEKIWPEGQKVTKLPDGSQEIPMRIAGFDKIKRWVLSLGPEGIALEPEKLREMFRKDLSRNLAQYSNPAVSINLMNGNEIHLPWDSEVMGER